jgi:cell division transport system permease protein
MTRQDAGRVRLDPLLAGDSTGPLLVWIVALTGYLVAIGGLALVLLSDDLRVWNRSVGNRLTVQIPAEASAPRIETILAMLRQTAGIRGVHLLEPAETAKLLEPWLGPAAATATLPVTRLVDVQLEPDAAIDSADLRQKLSSIMPGAQLDDHRQWLDNSRDTAIRLESLIAVGIAALALLALAWAAALTRARLAAHHQTIELLHLIGAADADVARPFQADALRRGALGGAIGAAAALVTLLAVVNILPPMAVPTAVAITDWRLWAVAIGVALIAGLVVTVVARITASRRLALMP